MFFPVQFRENNRWLGGVMASDSASCQCVRARAIDSLKVTGVDALKAMGVQAYGLCSISYFYEMKRLIWGTDGESPQVRGFYVL